MVQSLDLQVNLAQQVEVGRIYHAGTQQATALAEHLSAKLELQTKHAQTSVQTTQPSQEQQIETRKNNSRNPFWWKRHYKKKEKENKKTEEIPHPIKGKIIDVLR